MNRKQASVLTGVEGRRRRSHGGQTRFTAGSGLNHEPKQPSVKVGAEEFVEEDSGCHFKMLSTLVRIVVGGEFRNAYLKVTVKETVVHNVTENLYRAGVYGIVLKHRH